MLLNSTQPLYYHQKRNIVQLCGAWVRLISAVCLIMMHLQTFVIFQNSLTSHSQSSQIAHCLFYFQINSVTLGQVPPAS